MTIIPRRGPDPITIDDAMEQIRELKTDINDLRAELNQLKRQVVELQQQVEEERDDR